MSELETFPVLGTDDIARAAGFYCDVFGFELVFQWPLEGDAEFVALERGPSSLAIGTLRPPPELPARAVRPVGSGRGFTLCMYVDDVHATLEAVREFDGAAVLSDPVDHPWGERMAFVADPDDVLVLLTQTLPPPT